MFLRNPEIGVIADIVLFFLFCVFKQHECFFNLLHFLVDFMSIKVSNDLLAHGCSFDRYFIIRVSFEVQFIFLALCVVVRHTLLCDILFDSHEVLDSEFLLFLFFVLLLSPF